MELIDDWGANKRVVLPRSKAQPVSAKDIHERLATFEPHIVNVHCYEDVGYPWVQVVFDAVIHPSVALRLGNELAALSDASGVYLNSLRPRAVYFVLEPAFDPKPDLQASRYGAPLDEIKKSWGTLEKSTRSRGTEHPRGSAATRVTSR